MWFDFLVNIVIEIFFQFDFPFVEMILCKEVRFRPRIPISWNYNDHDFSEIKYQMSKQQVCSFS